MPRINWEKESRPREKIKLDGPKVPRHLVPIPDPGMFTGLLGEIADEASERTEADKVGVYASLLAVTGMLAGRKPHVMIGDRRHPLLVWPLLLGRTGAGRKGDAIASARLPSDAAFVELDKRTVTGLGSGEGLIWHIRDSDDKDGGTEDKRLLIIEEELSHIIAVSGKEGSTLSSVLRKAWDGGRLQSLTRSSPYVASWSHVAVIAAITPSEFRLRVTNRDLASGLWNRFLPLFVERRELIADPPAMDSDTLEEFSNRLKKAVNLASRAGRLELSPKASWILERELYPEFADLADEEDKVADFLERGTAYLRRISAQTAALAGRRQVMTSDLRSAAHLIRYSLASARYALDPGKRSPRVDRLQRAADEAYPELLDRTWIYNELFQKNSNTDDIQEAIDTLCTDERYRNRVGYRIYTEREIQREGGGRNRRQFGRVLPF